MKQEQACWLKVSPLPACVGPLIPGGLLSIEMVLEAQGRVLAGSGPTNSASRTRAASTFPSRESPG